MYQKLNIAIAALCLVVFSGKVHAQIVTTIAGSGVSGYSGDGGPATAAQIGSTPGIAVDAFGNVYITDAGRGVVRKINTAGVITTVAGTGTLGYSGDGGPATAAEMGNVVSVVTDNSGNIYIADASSYCNCIRKVDASGVISTITGFPTLTGYSGDGGPATAAMIHFPRGLVTDAAGNLYFVDVNNNRVRKITPSGIISTVAGNGIAGHSGDGGSALVASLTPKELGIDQHGNIYVGSGSSFGYHYIRKVTPSGTITTIAGTGTAGYAGDGGPASAATISLGSGGVCADTTGNIYFTDGGLRIRKIDATTGIVSTIAGTGVAGFSGDGCNAAAAQFNQPADVVTNPSSNLYISDMSNRRIRRIATDNPIAFTNGTVQFLNVCTDGSVSIDTLMSVSDADVGQDANWSLLTAPAHGTAAVVYSATTTGGALVPTGLTYSPSSGYSGTDTFSVVVADCGNNTDTTTVYVTVDASTDAGMIAGTDTLCVGNTASYTNTVSGGVWSSSSTAVCTISSTGVATGVTAGTSTLSYTATNGCGTASSIKDIVVLSATDCNTSVSNGAASQRGFMQIIPNPFSGGKGTIYVSLEQRELVNVTITASDGRMVHSFDTYSNTRTQFSLDAPTGLYFVKVASRSVVYTQKLLVR